MARITTSIMRIASVSLPQDIPLAIAANIFTAAGVLLLYVINLIFTQRIMRASHPNFGWHKALSLAFKILYTLIVVTIIMVITATVWTFYTLNPNTRRICRDIQLFGTTFFAFVSFLPIPIVLIGLIVPRHQAIDKFGNGRWRTKIRILLLSSFLVSFGAIYRCATTWITPVPKTQPIPYYMHKAAFYIVNFTIEIIVLFLYAVLRVDRRFHIPDAARGYGSYNGTQKTTSKDLPTTTPSIGDKDSLHDAEHKSPTSLRFFTEEETYDGEEESEVKQKDLEMGRSGLPRTTAPLKNSSSNLAIPPVAYSSNNRNKN
jgi:hypothetical protein